MLEKKVIELNELHDLLKSNTITASEYEILKKKIIDTNDVGESSKKTFKIKKYSFYFIIPVILTILLYPKISDYKKESLSEQDIANPQTANELPNQNLNSTNVSEIENNNLPELKTLEDIRMNFLDDSMDKISLILGKPDIRGDITEKKGFAVYYNKVIDDGKVKNLFIVYTGFYPNNYIASIDAIDFGEKGYAGIHYIIFDNQGNVTSNASIVY